MIISAGPMIAKFSLALSQSKRCRWMQMHPCLRSPLAGSRFAARTSVASRRLRIVRAHDWLQLSPRALATSNLLACGRTASFPGPAWCETGRASGNLILSDAARSLALGSQRPRHGNPTRIVMNSAFAAAIALSGTMLAGTAANAQTSASTLRPCMARVVYSEELPFAPLGSWLVKVTLEITPKNAAPYYVTLQERMPWQGAPPRRGQAFRAWCDPANPTRLQPASGAAIKSAF